MGDSSGEDDEDARPVSKVTLDSFHINKYEVTQKEFKELMGYNPSYFVFSSAKINLFIYRVKSAPC